MNDRLMTGGMIGTLIAALLAVLIISVNEVSIFSALLIGIILGAAGGAAGVVVAARKLL